MKPEQEFIGLHHLDPSIIVNRKELENYIKPKMRGFEVVKDEHRTTRHDILMPKRGSAKSAGYDFFLQHDITIPAGGEVKFFGDIKAYMQPHEVLLVFIRSSGGIKHGLRLKSGTGIIDADYYSNKDNDGNIGFVIQNTNDHDVAFVRGERLCLGMFTHYLITDDDEAEAERNGGWGHTGR